MRRRSGRGPPRRPPRRLRRSSAATVGHGCPPTEKAALAGLAAAERALADRRAKALLDVPGELARLLASVAAAGAGARVSADGGRRSERRAGQELEAVQAALAAEHAAVYGYGVVGGRIGEARRARPGPRTTPTGPGGTRWPAPCGTWAASRWRRPPAYALPFPVPDSAAAVRLAAELEERVAGVYSDLVRASEGGGGGTAAEALREAAVRAVRWRGGSVAFPGLAERAATASAYRPDFGDTSASTRTEGNDSRMAFEPPQRLVRALGETGAGRRWTTGWRGCPSAEQAVALRELTVERVQAPGGAAAWSCSCGG